MTMTKLESADLIAIGARVAADALTPVPSPCISVCRLDLAGAMCEGCFRTLEELRLWRHLDDDGKRAIWATLVQRIEDNSELAEAVPSGDAADGAGRAP